MGGCKGEGGSGTSGWHVRGSHRSKRHGENMGGGGGGGGGGGEERSVLQKRTMREEYVKEKWEKVR